MNKYIDADKLIAEIERQIEEVNIQCQKSRRPQFSLYGKINGLEQALNLVRSLQQEQPDEMDEDFFFDEVLKVYDDNDKYPPRSEEELTMLEIIARHFYELGLRTK